MEVNGFNLDVGEDGIRVEKYCTSPVVGYVESVHEELVVDTLNRPCKVIMCPFPAIRFSMAPSFPRRGPGFQL